VLSSFSDIAPPQQTASSYLFTIALVVLVLIILQIFSGFIKNLPIDKQKRYWINASIISCLLAILSVFLYFWTLNQFTYYYPPPPDKAIARRVAGLESELTETAKNYVKNSLHGNYLPAQLELNFPSEQIWLPGSTEKAHYALLISFTWFILSISISVFSVLEMKLVGVKKRRTSH
ncbi:MAG: hypothetical protein AB1489_40160, partial [Acidobacteriota bacterium]